MDDDSQGDGAAWRAFYFKVGGATASIVLAVGGCWLARVLELKPHGASSGFFNKEASLMIGNTLASGILLAASLVHMLPDASLGLASVTSFPLASVFAGTAFIFLSVLGEVVTELMPTRDTPHVSTACATYQASFALWPRLELQPPFEHCEDLGEGSAPDEHDAHGGDGGAHGPGHGHSHGHGIRLASKCLPCVEGAMMPGSGCPSHAARCRVHRHTDAPCSTAPHGSPPLRPAEPPLVPLSLGPEVPFAVDSRQPGAVHGSLTASLAEPFLDPRHAVHAHDEELRKVALCHVRAEGGGAIAEVKSFLLFSALCFHSIMEGLGMGSSNNNGLLFGVMVAVLAHKGLAAFALGCSLTQSDLPRWKFWAFVAIFAAGTPVGITIGSLSARIGSAAAQSVTSAVCVALSSGTFLQVSAMELLPRALAEEKHKLKGCAGLASAHTPREQIVRLRHEAAAGWGSP